MNDWAADIVETPKDGACFFTALSLAINDSLGLWCSFDVLRRSMEKYWDLYHKVTNVILTEVTPDLIRFICSLNIDKNILIMFNEEAKFLKAKQFQTTEQLGNHMRKKTTWGDQASLFAFLKSLDFKCGVLIFDNSSLIRFPEEWTRNKKLYMCLLRDNNHYNLIRFWRDKKPLSLCLPRGVVVEILHIMCEVDDINEDKRIPVI